MTAVSGFPLMLNQEVPLGYGYAAEAFRAEHYDATSGGNGVGSPTALKVHAQPAPDGTIRTNPGGATLRSTYASQEGQSYHAYFGPRTVSVSPAGSSAGGRTDLVVAQICDPEHDTHWSYSGEYPIPAETAKDMEFQRIHVFEGRDQTAHLDFPHVLLAEISRPPNTTIVTPEHITDLRELANPKNHLHFRANNMQSEDYGTLSTAVTIWPTNSIHTTRIPEWASRVQVLGNWNTIAADTTNRTVGVVHIDLTHPDGSVLRTENSRFQNVRVGGNAPTETLNVILSDNRPVPEKFRGQLVTVRMRGTKTSGPNIYMDGNSSWSVQLYFEQEIA